MKCDTGVQASAQCTHASSSVRVMFIIAEETAAVRYTRWLQVQVALRKRFFWQQERGQGARLMSLLQFMVAQSVEECLR